VHHFYTVEAFAGHDSHLIDIALLGAVWDSPGTCQGAQSTNRRWLCAYSDEIVHEFRSCCPLPERSDASIDIIPSSGRRGQGRVGLAP
jgi:hypothetical protein